VAAYNRLFQREETMKSGIALVLVLALFAGAVQAQDVDWDLNNFGIFFDEGGTETSTNVPMGEMVHAYLVVINPTFTELVTGFEIQGLRLSGFSDYPFWPETDGLPMEFAPRVGGVGVDIENCNIWWDSNVNTVCQNVMLAMPQPMAGNTVLADISHMVMNAGSLGFFYPSGHLNLLLADGSQVSLISSTYPISTMPPTFHLCATVNSDYGPVGVQETTLGGIKALYR
jgi:hypothetical protein